MIYKICGHKETFENQDKDCDCNEYKRLDKIIWDKLHTTPIDESNKLFTSDSKWGTLDNLRFAKSGGVPKKINCKSCKDYRKSLRASVEKQ